MAIQPAATESAVERDPAAEVSAGFPVTDRPSWLVLIGVAALVAAGVIWAIFGSAPDTVTGSGMVVPADGFQVVGQAVTGSVEKVSVTTGDVVKANQVVANVRQENGTQVAVRAPVDGRVTSVLARPGTVTSVGTSIVTLVPLQSRDVVVGFVPAGPGKRIEVGMPARVSLASVPRSQYGTIEGEVTAVSPLPVSMDRLLLLTGDNESLADYFLSHGPVLEVTVELYQANTPTGYKWTVGQGPTEPVTTGTLADVSVVVSEASPLERIL